MADIDYEEIFQAAPGAAVVLDLDLSILAVNEAYLKVSGRQREDLIGRNILRTFPDNPDDPSADGNRNLRTSLTRVIESGERDIMALQKYDVERSDLPGVYEERYWSPVNAPVLGPDGRTKWIIHRVEEVTRFIQQVRHLENRTGAPLTPDEQAMEAEIFARSRELADLNEELRLAHAKEQQVALSLQQAMLPAPSQAQRRDVAVRYLPAVGSLNVCGDWYDVIDLPGDRLAVAVGDVVGHGLSAAGVMGQLRSALGAAIRATEQPARALNVLCRYARSVDGALTTTVVQAVIDRERRVVIYSRAGHPPPILCHADGSAEVLDKVVDPPLAVTDRQRPRTQLDVPFKPGATLVLYTDGLIERRDSDIDNGVARLAESLSRHHRLDPHTLAEKLLSDLGAGAGLADDTALLIVRL